MLNSLRQSVKKLDDADHPLLWPILSIIYVVWAVKQKVDGLVRRGRAFWAATALQDIHQACNYTKPDRYPRVFQFCQQLLADRGRLSLLSFGCSTGEEAFTLRSYFPDARITGVDINPRNIRICRKRNNDRKIQFDVVRRQALESAQRFDAIFCMAVFQRTENRNELVQDSSQIYPFVKFEQQVNVLDQCLNVGGLLVIHICNYRFGDCGVAFKYEVIRAPFDVLREVPLFDVDNRKLANSPAAEIIYRKVR